MNSYCFYRPATKHATNHDHLSEKETCPSSSFVKDLIKQEKEYEAIANADLNDHNLSDILLTMTNTELQAQANDGTPKAPTYTSLRSISDYAVGDPLRSEDFKFLCYSKDAMAFAVHDLRPGDCAFVLRSDGSYTYSVFSHANGNASLSFRVDKQGHSKVVSVSSLATTARVRVPMLHHKEQSPRPQGLVRQQHSRSLTSNRHTIGPWKNRAPKSQARKNRKPGISMSLPPTIEVTKEMERVNKEDASKFSSKRYGTSARNNRAPKSQARKTRPPGISSSLPPSIEITKSDGPKLSPNRHLMGFREIRASTSQARKNRPPGISSSLPSSNKATKDDASKLPTNRHSIRVREVKVPTSQGRENKPSGISSSLQPSIKDTKDDASELSTNCNSLRVRIREPTSQARENRPSGISSSYQGRHRNGARRQ